VTEQFVLSPIRLILATSQSFHLAHVRVQVVPDRFRDDRQLLPMKERLMLRCLILMAVFAGSSLTIPGCGPQDEVTIAPPPEMTEEDWIAKDKERFEREGGQNVD
jgi:hypothetical protein